MQYFIGYKEYRSEKPFDPSLLVTFQKRLPEKVKNRIIERLFIEAAEEDQDAKMIKMITAPPAAREVPVQIQKLPSNKGTLIIDTTCAPADIAYPTDLELCDKARRWTEVIFDRYWKFFGPVNSRDEKPRTYREITRRRFLKF